MTDVPFSSYERHAAEQSTTTPRRNHTVALLLLLLAMLLFAWYLLIQRQQASTQPIVTTPTVSETAPEAVATPAAEPSTRSARIERPRAAATTRPRFSAPERILAQSPAPTYPAQALRRGEGGTVVLRVNVGPDGRPTDIAFADRSNSRELDRAARDAVSKWHFSPAIENGKPVAAVVEVPVDFRPQQ
ncbi:MAG TPA: energy transducer TonB [Lysobacter sp.]